MQFTSIARQKNNSSVFLNDILRINNKMVSRSKLCELNEKLDKYVSNNSDLALALTSKKRKIAELEEIILANEALVLDAKLVICENKRLKAQLETKTQQCETIHEDSLKMSQQLVQWRELVTDIIRFNTNKFNEAVKLIVPPKSMAQQSAPIAKLDGEHQKVEVRPTDETKNHSTVHKSKDIKAVRAASQGHTCDPTVNEIKSIVEVLEESLKNSTKNLEKAASPPITSIPIPITPIVQIIYNKDEPEFSDDSIAEQPSIPMLDSTPKQRSFEVEKVSDIELSEAFNTSETPTNSIDMLNGSESIEAASDVQLSIPEIKITKSSEPPCLPKKRKSDENFLRIPKKSMSRKRKSSDDLAPAFNAKSPRLSGGSDQNRSSFNNSSASLSSCNLSPVNEQSKSNSYTTDTSSMLPLSSTSKSIHLANKTPILSPLVPPSKRSSVYVHGKYTFVQTTPSKFSNDSQSKANENLQKIPSKTPSKVQVRARKPNIQKTPRNTPRKTPNQLTQKAIENQEKIPMKTPKNVVRVRGKYTKVHKTPKKELNYLNPKEIENEQYTPTKIPRLIHSKVESSLKSSKSNSMFSPTVNQASYERRSRQPTFLMIPDTDIKSEFESPRSPLAMIAGNANRPNNAIHQADIYRKIKHEENKIDVEVASTARKRSSRRAAPVDYREPTMKYKGRF